MESNKLIKDYNIWSNFTYIIASIYSIVLGSTMPILDTYRAMFIVFGILLFLTGLISMIYHSQTPSYNTDRSKVNTKEYKISLETDISLALVSFFYGLVFFLIRLYVVKSKRVILEDPTLWFTILFGVISLIFYGIASGYENGVHSCNKNDKKCINNNLDAYDIFHSNWHLFTGISILFGITLLRHTFNRLG